MPLKLHLIFTGFLIAAAIFLGGGLLAVPEIISGQADLLSKRSATFLEACLGIGLVFVFGTLAALLGRVYALEKEVEKIKAKQPDN